MSRFPSFKNNAANLLAAAAGFTIIMFFTWHGGIGVEPDSVVYLSTAESLHAHKKLIDFAGNPTVDFPAGYPAFLGLLSLLTGLKPLVFAPFVNATLFAILIYLAGYIMDRFKSRSKWYKWAILSCIVISPCLLEVYSFLMSESLFLVLETFFFIAITRYLQRYSVKALIVAAILASLAAITRYAGITVIGCGGLLLLLDSKLSLRKKITDVSTFTLVSLVPLVLNLARNHAVSGTITGGRESSTTSLWENMHDAGSVFYDWLPFLQGHYKGAGLFFLLVLMAVGFFCIRQFLRHRRLADYEDVTGFFTVFYLLFIVGIASLSRFETLNSRFMSPVFIPLLWQGSHWIVSAGQRTNAFIKRSTMAMSVLIFLLFQFGQLSADYETWDGVKDAGIPGYTEDQWRYSETILFIQKDSLPLRDGYTIYSDASDAVWFFTGKVGKFLPHKEYKPGISSFLADPHCYVLWFDDGENPDLVDKDFITKVKKMTLVKQFSDGAIYEYHE